MIVNEENFEQYLLRYCEGTLSSRERADVERALAAHPEWSELVELYKDSPRLPSADPAPYAHWERLVDGGGRRRKVLLWWPSVAAAACVALVVGLLLRSHQSEIQVASTTHLQPPLPAVTTVETPDEPQVTAPDEAPKPVSVQRAAQKTPRSTTQVAIDNKNADNTSLRFAERETLQSSSQPVVAVAMQKEPEMAQPAERIGGDKNAVVATPVKQEPFYTDQLITYLDDGDNSAVVSSQSDGPSSGIINQFASLVGMGVRLVNRTGEQHNECVERFYRKENRDAENKKITQTLIAALF